MPHWFISHSTKDGGQEAQALARALEARGEKCWIAPRDVLTGVPYPGQITNAIKEAKTLVVLVTPGSNASVDVLQEVQIANNLKVKITPVIVGGTTPSPDLIYFLGVRHQAMWTNADQVADAILGTVGPGVAAAAPISARHEPADAAPAATLPSWAMPAGIAGAVVALLVALFVIDPFGLRTPNAPPEPQASAETSPSWVSGADITVDSQAGTVFRDCEDCPDMVVIPGGTFLMGSPEDEAGRQADEGPQQGLTVGAFAVGAYEVTFAEWDACVAGGGCASRPTPSDQGWGRDNRPAVDVSWNDAQEYVQWLSGKTGQSYALLTEAEWEYAARGGTATITSFGEDTASLGSFAWYADNSGATTQPVGGKSANPFGLYDMHGNVWEWVADCYRSTLVGQTVEAHTVDQCEAQVVRGASFEDPAGAVRSAIRSRSPAGDTFPSTGFRLARALAAPGQ